MQFHRSSSSRIALLWWVGGLLLILLGTLAPFNFTLLFMGKKEALRSFFQHPSDWVDFYGNIVLFFPYGLGLGLLLKGRVMPLWMKLVSLVGLSFGLTVTVEVLQLFLPSRTSSATDIFTNTIGGTLSGLYVLFGWRRYACQVLRVLQGMVSDKSGGGSAAAVGRIDEWGGVDAAKHDGLDELEYGVSAGDRAGGDGRVSVVGDGFGAVDGESGLE